MSPRRASNDFLRMVMRGFDAAVAMLVSTLYFWHLPDLAFTFGTEYPLLIVVGGLLLPAIGEIFGLYEPWRGRSVFSMFGSYFASWLGTVLLISAFLVVTQSGYIYSRLWMGLSALSVLAIGLLSRGLLYGYLRRLRARGRNIKSILFIGPAANAEQTRQRLADMPHIGYRIDQTIPYTHDDQVLEDVVRLAKESVFKRDFDEIWLSFPLSCGNTVKALADSLIGVPVNVRYFPDLSDVRLLNHRVAQVADMFSIDLNYSPLHGPARIVKSIEDYVLGTLLFIGFLPIMLLIALGVWLSTGRPVLFKQYRHGLDGKRFKIYKFRTMHLHPVGEGTRQAHRGDPRITPLGRWLRRTSLDELPQLYNVLQGRMSLVGPRPHALDHNAFYKDLIVKYMQRHRVKPGITGWAQIYGLRGETRDVVDMEQRVDHDLYYINNWTLGMDVKILALTVKRGFFNAQP
ncbi:undecaprenyl-phosphate glucose phosphotransferase [Salinicola sp. JS01]|uniref:undecaprenyl-phosphate glucose phosphotransferase n=1 Tax=Salinicola sp. JS01 TaxID=3050071 RepID=UPI00255B7128|nr:undecaprenyl-phosphate glucose phosphotransferase [Salinicola sp. JS01]WIX33790.1 undecaprenyl-phosphate glucose phosphotransferase [Salinicola sp. JS01]